MIDRWYQGLHQDYLFIYVNRCYMYRGSEQFAFQRIICQHEGKGGERRQENMEYWEKQSPGYIYLSHYSGVDSADHMIKNAAIRFTSWWYWHAPYLHVLSMGVVAAYDMYNQCCDGTLDTSWEIDKSRRLSFSAFCQKLYHSRCLNMTHRNWNIRAIRNSDTRLVTQVNKKRQSLQLERRNHNKLITYDKGGINMANFQKAMMTERLSHGNDLNKLSVHLQCIEKKTNQMTCEVCGERTYWKCIPCNSAICTTDGRRGWNGGKCALTFHNPVFWGLARCDSHLHNMKATDWVAHTQAQKKRHEDSITNLMKNIWMWVMNGMESQQVYEL